MPAMHHQTFKARYHECDAYGYLKNISYLRWMQESAFAASAAVGYDFAQYHRIGQLWLVRESDIEYLVPLRYGDEVEIKTWVMDIRRFRSMRAYEIRNAETRELVARATTDWVYLDTETLRPVSIPQAMQTAFFPEGVPETSLTRVRHPKYPRPVHDVPILHKVVKWNDLDMMWHVNNANYLDYMDEAEKHAWCEYGWSMQRVRQNGWHLYVQHQRITYLHPAVLGDEVIIATWCSDFVADTALRHFEILRASDSAQLAQAQSRWGVCDVETREALAIPEVLYGL